MTENKHNYLNEFNKTLDNDLDSCQWTVSIAKNVKARRRNGLIGKVVILLGVIGMVSGIAELSVSHNDTAYSQFYAYISEDVDYDYDILDLEE